MKNFYLLILSLMFTISHYGQNLAAIDRLNTTGPGATAVGTTVNVTATGLTRTGLTFEGSAGVGNFSSSNWNTETTLPASPSKYLQWSITVDPGYDMNLTLILMSIRRANPQAPKRVRIAYSLDNFATTFAVGAEYTYANSETTRRDLLIPLSGVEAASGETITFRLYGYDASNAQGVLNVAINPGGPLLGVADPGIRIIGSVTNSDLFYTEGAWEPMEPSASTFLNDAFILDGTYTLSSNIFLNNLTVRSLGNVVVPAGTIAIVNNTFLESTSINYPSLIVDGAITGIVNYSRHVNINNPGTGSTTGNNDLISAPLTGQTFSAFASNNANIVSDPNNFQRKLFGPFNKSTGTYQLYNTSIDGGTILSPGTGYRAASSDNGSFIFTGAVNSFPVSVPILNSGPQYQEWNLVGNPYPSYITLEDFLAANNTEFNVNASGVYGYDGQASDGWIIWNQAYADANPGEVITPGQGFLVASKVGGGTISFDPIMRTTGNTDDFIFGRNSNNTIGNITHLKLKASNNALDTYADFYFSDNATLGLDPGYDAAVYGYNAPDFGIYSHLVQNNTGIDMAIQSIGNADLNSEVIVPLGINASQGQEVTVSIDQSTLASDVQVYLEDNVTGIFTLLNTNDYSFVPTSNLTDTGRFFLRFTNETLSTTDTNLNGLHVYTSSSPKAVIVKGLLSETTNLKIYDVQGRVVLSTSLETSSNSNQVDVSSLSSGAYIVKLTNNTQEKTQKVIIK